MKPGKRDAAYLWDMLDAACRARRLTSGMDFAAFVDDERRRRNDETMARSPSSASVNGPALCTSSVAVSRAFSPHGMDGGGGDRFGGSPRMGL